MSAPTRPAVLQALEIDRFVAFYRTILVKGIDLSAATAVMQIRLDWNTGGVPLLSISTTPSTDGSLTFTLDGFDTLIEMEIARSSIVTLPFAAERADDMRLVWDMQITHDGRTAVWFRGDAVIIGGSVQ